MTYAEKLKDPRWQKVRLQVFEAAGWRCEDCGESTKTLNCHHKYYERNTEPWDYPMEAFAALCNECHDEAGVDMQRVRDALKGAARRGYDPAEVATLLEECIQLDGILEVAHLVGWLKLIPNRAAAGRILRDACEQAELECERFHEQCLASAEMAVRDGK